MKKSIYILGGLAASIAIMAAGYFHFLANNHNGAVEVALEKIVENKRVYGECETANIITCPTEVMDSILDSAQIVGQYHDAIENRNISIAGAAVSLFGCWILSFIVGSLHRAREAGLHRKAKNAVGNTLAASVQNTTDSIAASVQRTANSMERAKGRTKECPFCAEWIKPNAKICPHCRSAITYS